MELWEILVPTQYNDTKTPVSTKHHKEFDKYVRSISGGLSIFKPIKGQWVHQDELYEERNIPVRIACTESEIRQIIKFALNHYRQIAIMAYRISDKIFITYKNN